MLAAAAGYHDFVRILLRHGADPLISSESNGYLALHWACQRCNGECVRLLLGASNSECQLNARDANGMTPLCVACECNTIAYMYNYCSDMSVVDCTVQCNDVYTNIIGITFVMSIGSHSSSLCREESVPNVFISTVTWDCDISSGGTANTKRSKCA